MSEPSGVPFREPSDPTGIEGVEPAGPPWPDQALGLLRHGRIEILGRLIDASNASFCCRVVRADSTHGSAQCVYKPTRGERPLDDFPDRTLAQREVAAYLVSEATGWSIVPPTVLREGPFGLGMVQLWVDVDPSVDVVRLIREGDPQLRRVAVFDAIINNADRKIGHLLSVLSGHIFGVDHGVCFSADPKLRTVLWGWRGEPLTQGEREVLEQVRSALAADLGGALKTLLSRDEIGATVRRIDALLAGGLLPQPDPRRPALPWPIY